MFAKVKTEKPDASRKQSTEGFFVALGYKPLPKSIVSESPAAAAVNSNTTTEKSKEAIMGMQSKNDM